MILAAAAALLCSCTSVITDAFLELENEQLVFPAAGDILSAKFTASGSWTAESSEPGWCKISPGSGESGLTTLKVTALNNTSGDERNATITISCGLVKKTIDVVQLEPNSISVDIRSIEVPAEGGSYKVNVKHNVEFTVQVDNASKSWISAEVMPSAKATTTDVIKIDVQPNPDGWTRDGIVRINSQFGTEIINVTQEAADIFALSQTSVTVSGKGGDFTVSVSGKKTYHVTNVPDWVTETSVENRTHTFHVDENPSDSPREGTLVFCDDGGVCLPFMLTQEGLPSWARGNFRHHSLFMRFTATWCGWCPLMNKSVKKAQELYPDKIMHLALHGSGSSLYFSPTDGLMNQYKIGGFPTGIVDGRIEINNDDVDVVAPLIVNAAKETESLYGTVTGARIETSLTGKTVNVNATVYFTAPGSYTVHAFIVEDNIDTAQTDYLDGDHASYIHDGVARKMLSDAKGEACTQTESFSFKDFSWSANISGKTENTRILIYVQTKYGMREKKRSANYGEYYVDNCFTVKAGETLELETE